MVEELVVVEAKPKSGAKTTEFWLTLLASVCGFILASGSLVEGSTAALVVGGLMVVLAALGYTKGRTSVKVAEEKRKAEESKAAGLLAMARDKIEELKAGREKAKAVKDAKQEAFLLTRIPLGTVFDLVSEYTFHPPDKRRRDIDNCLAMMKNYQDGVYNALGVDDSSIRRTVLEWGEVVKGGKVVLRLEEME